MRHIDATNPAGRSRCEHLAASAVLRDDRAKYGMSGCSSKPALSGKFTSHAAERRMSSTCADRGYPVVWPGCVYA